METVLFIATIAALFGAWLVSEGNKNGFAIWIITNFVFAINNYMIGQWQQGLLFSVYLILAINGLRKKS